MNATKSTVNNSAKNVSNGAVNDPAVLRSHRNSRSSIAVWKFGGTSVADPERLRAVAERMVTEQRGGRRVVAVLSAMGKATDQLVDQAYAMSTNPSPRELDALLSVGETMSCALAAMAVHELGEKAVSLSAAQAGIRTDGRHGNARLRELQPERITAALDEGSIVLVTGFQGVSERDEVTTLGRGGSDASAVAVAAGLGVGECEIFTDVPAVFSADPRVVPNARRLRTLRHQEMLELAEAGAGVLQPRSVELAAAHGIDIHLRSSFTTEEGTWIRGDNATFEDHEVTGVAHRDQENLYVALGTSASAIASLLAEKAMPVGAIVPLGDQVLFTAPGATQAEVTGALAEVASDVATHEDLGTVSVVSMGMTRKPEITSATLAALESAGIAPRLVTTTPGRVTVHVAAARVHDAVRLLHEQFICASGELAGENQTTNPVAA
jgi:aspartate kinase